MTKCPKCGYEFKEKVSIKTIDLQAEVSTDEKFFLSQGIDNECWTEFLSKGNSMAIVSEKEIN